MSDVWSIAARLEAEGTPFVAITLVSSRGHAPHDPGAKAVVAAAGLQGGTIGGGRVEARAILHAVELLTRASATPPELVTWNLQRDIGMTCGGEVTYLFEVQRRDHWQVVLFGAGHVSQALVRALLPLELQLTCVDPRADWIAKLPTSPRLTARMLAAPESWVEQTDGSEFFVVITQGHATDLPVLEAIFKRHPTPRYVGVIGSEPKGTKLRSELRARGVSEASLELLRIPIGLPIGTNQPAEIAVSIVAELIQVRGATGSRLP